MKVCSRCKQEKSLDEFSGRKKKSHYCKVCISKYTKEHREQIQIRETKKKRQRKLDAIKYLGGKCKICGKYPHPAAMDIYHRDPSLKEYSITHYLRYPWNKVKKELDKCDLLCAICHRIIHSEMDGE